MLSERAAETLRPLIMTLRIIVIALCLGVLSFGIYTIVHNAGKQQTFGTKVNFLFLGMAVPMFVAGFVLPRLLSKGTRVGAVSPKDVSDEANSAASAFALIQTSTIVGCALFEGAAFMNLVSYMLDAELVHLAVSGIALLFIMLHFPLTSRVEQRIEEQLQAERDAKQLQA